MTISIGLDNNPKDRYIVYSRDGCEWCDKAKELLIQNNFPHTEYKLGVHYTKETLREKLGLTDYDRLTVPQIFYNGKHIGGHDHLVRHLDERFGAGAGDGGFI